MGAPHKMFEPEEFAARLSRIRQRRIREIGNLIQKALCEKVAVYLLVNSQEDILKGWEFWSTHFGWDKTITPDYPFYVKVGPFNTEGGISIWLTELAE